MKGGLVQELVLIVNDLKQQNKSINQTLRYLKKTKSLSALALNTNHNKSQIKSIVSHSCIVSDSCKQQQRVLPLKQKTQSMRRCTSCKMMSGQKENKQNMQRKTTQSSQTLPKKKKKLKQSQNKVELKKNNRNLISARLSSPVKKMTNYYLNMIKNKRSIKKI